MWIETVGKVVGAIGKICMLVPRSAKTIGFMFSLVLLLFIFYFDMPLWQAFGAGVPMYGALFYIRQLEKKKLREQLF